MGLLSIVIAGLLTFAAAADINLPKPSQEGYNVSISHTALYDIGRSDPYNPISAHRAVMVSLYFPINSTQCTEACPSEYMPRGTALLANKEFFGNDQAGVFESVRGQTCCEASGTLNPRNHTLVVLEPGVGTSRYMYGAMAQEIASQGNPVVTIDHPSDSLLVEFDAWNDEASDHTVVEKSIDLSPMNPITCWNSTVEKAVQTRIADIKFVLARLNDPRIVNKLLENFSVSSPFATAEVGIIGHGLGGAVATYLTATDPRFTISINMGGSAPPLTEDVVNEVVYFGLGSYNRHHDHLWQDAWLHLKGKATELDMQGGGFMQYSDLPLIAELAGKGIKPAGVSGLGDREGVRSWQIGAYFARVYLTSALRARWEDAVDRSLELMKLKNVYQEMLPYQP